MIFHAEGLCAEKKLSNELDVPILSISSLESLINFLETSSQKDIAERLKSSIER